MPYLILGLAGVFGIYLIARGLRGKNPAQVRRLLGVVVALVVTLMFGFVAASGRLGPVGWVALALPAIFFWRNIRQAVRNLGGPTPGGASDIETRFLRMTLEHDSGVLRGTVLDGTYRGRHLEEMSLDELRDLLRECRVEDARSASVLETYLDRVHGAGWRDASGESQQRHGGRQESRHGGADSGGAMSAAQAYEILGLSPGATETEIREAHRRLLKANHPDHGGSTYIAAQINLAKDTLLPGG